VDLVFYSNSGELEYDFVVHSGADPRQIQLTVEGQDRMRLDDKSGDVVLTTTGGAELRQTHLKTYQQVEDRRVDIAGEYELLDHGQAAFRQGAYDRQRPLVIDPTVSFSAFLNYALAYAVAVDKNGNSYMTGAACEDFLVTNGSKYQLCKQPNFWFCRLLR
jgi:hypothetical protein